MSAPTASSAQQAMETLTAQWYNALVTGLSLDRSTFQLFQGNGALGTTSETLWNIFDVVPPASVSNYYNPSQANVFSSNYGAVINNLVPQNSNSFQAHMGDYYARWLTYLGTSPKIPEKGGILALFEQWAALHLPPNLAQQCITDYQQISQGAVPVAVQMWLDAGGAGKQKAYNATVADLSAQLVGTRGGQATFDSSTQSSDVSDTWAKGSVGGWYDIFAGEASGQWDKFSATVATSHLQVEATFAHVLTFTAGPLTKPSQDPILSQYTPWYWNPALNLALQHDDNTVWQHAAPTWDDTFGPDGNLLRTTSSLVIVDGIDITVTSSASFSSAEQQEISAKAEVGFWPFFEASASGGWSNEIEFDDAGTMSMSSSSPQGNPQVLGAIVTPIAQAVADPQRSGVEALDLPVELTALKGRGGGTCYSGRNCTGKVLNNRDAHNCKNSGGKSWRSPLDGTCYNL